MEKQSFVFYETFEKQLSELTDDLQLKFYKIIIAYGLHGTEPELKGLELALWLGFKKEFNKTMGVFDYDA